ncbi:MAG: winged helix-turn-helix domain-containing protein [Cyclobacteriaceae bacterium]
MKNLFEQLDRILEHRVRLQIMSVLVANESYDFNSLKEVLNVTDGNLATNLKALEKEKYISVSKSFVNRKPNTKYRATEKGRNAFKKHLDALEQLIKNNAKNFN